MYRSTVRVSARSSLYKYLFRAFAVTETIESAYALTPNGTLMDLSEQEMMDCSNGYYDSLHGCSGGDTCTALSWMLTVGFHL